LGTLKGRGVFSDPENRLSLLETAMDMMDASPGDPKTVIQYARGHAFPAFSDSLKNPRRQNACPFSLFKTGTHLREDPFISGLGSDLLYGADDGSGYDPYRWNGSAFTRVADLNAAWMWSGGDFNGDLYLHVNTGAYDHEPWQLWATHYDFLMSRMP